MKQILKEIHETQKATKKEVFQELLDYAEAHELDFDLKRLLGKLGHFVVTPTLNRSRDIAWLKKALKDFEPTSNLHLIRKSEHGDLVASNGVMMFILNLGIIGEEPTFICPLTGIDIGSDVNSYTYPDYTKVIIEGDAMPYEESGIKLSEHATLQNGEKIYEYRVDGSNYGLSKSQFDAVFGKGGLNLAETSVKFCHKSGRVQFESGNRTAIISPFRL